MQGFPIWLTQYLILWTVYSALFEIPPFLIGILAEWQLNCMYLILRQEMSLSCSKSTVPRRLTELGYNKKFSNWIPRELSPNHECERQKFQNFSLIVSGVVHLSTKLLLVIKRGLHATNMAKRAWSLMPPCNGQEGARFGLKYLLYILWNPSGVFTMGF